MHLGQLYTNPPTPDWLRKWPQEGASERVLLLDSPISLSLFCNADAPSFFFQLHYLEQFLPDLCQTWYRCTWGPSLLTLLKLSRYNDFWIFYDFFENLFSKVLIGKFNMGFFADGYILKSSGQICAKLGTDERRVGLY